MNKTNGKKVMKDCIFYDKERQKCKALKEVYRGIEEKPCCFYKPKWKGEKGNGEQL